MIEIWFADEARIGQKNKITRRWAKRGTRPSAPKDQRTASAYIFGAICPAQGKGAGLVLPRWGKARLKRRAMRHATSRKAARTRFRCFVESHDRVPRCPGEHVWPQVWPSTHLPRASGTPLKDHSFCVPRGATDLSLWTP